LEVVVVKGLWRFIPFAVVAIALEAQAHGGAHDDRAQPRPVQTTPATAQSAPPRVPTVSLDAPQQGNRNAAVVIVEFADYQCPFCRRFHLEQLPKLKKQFIDTGKAQYLFKDFPLRQHREAMPAAVFAHCAGEQGKYWPMQTLLFQNQERLGDVLYADLTKRLSLDAKKMKTCRADPLMRYPIEQANAEAIQLGLKSTPTVLLGHRQGDQVVILRMAPGLPDFDDLVREIELMQKNASKPLKKQATQPGGN